VESTAWPASYRTAIFCMIEEIVDGKRQVTEVPEVTSVSAEREGWELAYTYFHRLAVRISP
jgi:hypothetical protein